jgi:hypothetical protein
MAETGDSLALAASMPPAGSVLGSETVHAEAPIEFEYRHGFGLLGHAAEMNLGRCVL